MVNEVKTVKDAFDKFIKKCLIEGEELITKGNNEKIFDSKSIKQCYEELKNLEEIPYSGDYKKLLLHCYWLMNFFGEKTSKIKQFNEEYNTDSSLFPEDKICNIGQAYTGVTNKEVILFILALLFNVREYVEKNRNQESDVVKKKIVSLINIDGRNKSVIGPSEDKRICNPIANILLHLSSPNQFIPICAQSNKDDIWKHLSFLINQGNGYNETLLIELDAKVKEIVSEGFYNKSIRPFWDTPKMSTKADNDGGLPLNTLLTFKKAVVLYGPPGTSKTYTARELAKNVISAAFAENLKKNTENKQELFQKFIKNEDLIYGEKRNNEEITNQKNDANDEKQSILSHIHRLQLHPNYSYDDFIIGKTIVDNGVKTKPGYLLRLIEKISKDGSKFKDLPHIVILDEINRVDISRVFGELFTAMEPGYRKEGIELSLTENDAQPQRLKVPENMYFIGTMNMIDFSLEQVDFALRRRFAWVESNYDDGRLKDIIDYKIKKEGLVGSIKDEDVKSYINRCTSLNNLISKENNLGDAYKIGHAFFAEIVDIYKEINANNKWNASIEFLWNISVKPTIIAYCGSMDSNMVEDFINKCHDVFNPKKADKVKGAEVKQLPDETN
jgi:5-methylcytosine-specific restriction protein B